MKILKIIGWIVLIPLFIYFLPVCMIRHLWGSGGNEPEVEAYRRETRGH